MCNSQQVNSSLTEWKTFKGLIVHNQCLMFLQTCNTNSVANTEFKKNINFGD